MRAIPTNNVTGEPILGEDLYTAEGKVLLRAGSKLTNALIEKINSNKIYTVYINDVHSDVEVDRLVEQSFRVKGIQLIKELFTAAAKKKEILSIHNKLLKYAEDVMYEISGSKDNQIEYMDIKNVDAYMYSSALNVALMSALLAWELKLNNDMVKQVFLGGIYHDIGIAMIPADVSNKSKELSTEEKMMILKHPSNGHKYLKEMSFLTAYVKAITLHHHEHIDGTGYPNRVKGDDINYYAQIVGIADIYDAMTSDRPYRRAVAPQEAIEYIMGAAGTHFNMQIAQAFINKINPYPRGSIVELSNGKLAVVDSVQKDLPLRPTVRVITKVGDTFEYEVMDLKAHPSIVVKGICYDEVI